jgi:hypothetical protein
VKVLTRNCGVLSSESMKSKIMHSTCMSSVTLFCGCTVNLFRLSGQSCYSVPQRKVVDFVLMAYRMILVSSMCQKTAAKKHKDVYWYINIRIHTYICYVKSEI